MSVLTNPRGALTALATAVAVTVTALGIQMGLTDAPASCLGLPTAGGDNYGLEVVWASTDRGTVALMRVDNLVYAIPAEDLPSATRPRNPLPADEIHFNSLPNNSIGSFFADVLPADAIPKNALPGKFVAELGFPAGQLITLDAGRGATVPGVATWAVVGGQMNLVTSVQGLYWAIPSNAIPSNALPASAIPSNAILSKVVSSSAIPSNALPASAIPSNAIPAEAINGHLLLREALPAAALTNAGHYAGGFVQVVDKVIAHTWAMTADGRVVMALPSSALPSSALPSSLIAGTGLSALPASAIPSNAIPSNALPASALPASAIPSNALPAAALPASALPAAALPASLVSKNLMSLEAVGLLPGDQGMANQVLLSGIDSNQFTAIPSNALPSSALPSSALPSSALPSSALPSSALPASELPVSFRLKALTLTGDTDQATRVGNESGPPLLLTQRSRSTTLVGMGAPRGLRGGPCSPVEQFAVAVAGGFSEDGTSWWRERLVRVTEPEVTYADHPRWTLSRDGVIEVAAADDTMSNADPGQEIGEDTDKDDDGHPATKFGGGDCNDNNPSIHPGATDTPGDGIDQDCDGADAPDPGQEIGEDSDKDDDGHPATKFGGGDCNDNDASIHPGATDTPGDGIDQDCDGTDATTPTVDPDTDGDGYVAGDCNNNDASIHPGATDTPGDGIDQDCDGTDATTPTQPPPPPPTLTISAVELYGPSTIEESIIYNGTQQCDSPFVTAIDAWMSNEVNGSFVAVGPSDLDSVWMSWKVGAYLGSKEMEYLQPDLWSANFGPFDTGAVTSDTVVTVTVTMTRLDGTTDSDSVQLTVRNCDAADEGS